MSASENSAPEMASNTVSSSPERLGEEVIHLTHELRGMLGDHLELAILETRLTVSTVLRMVIIAIVAAVVLVSAWLALIGSAVLALISLGLAPAIAMLLLVVANLFLGFLCWLGLRRKSHSIGWPATLRVLRPPS